MEWYDALIMGVVQGVAEFLPISSSGQLEICHEILGVNTSGADALQFDIALHVATVLSTVVVLWHEFSGICKSVFTWHKDDNFYTFWKILLSCVPVLIVAVVFEKYIEAFFGGNLLVVGICQLMTAALLVFAYFYRTRGFLASYPVRKYGSEGRPIGWGDAFTIGVAQAVAVLPGLSRSGSTIATGIILGNKREQVAKFSFLMVIIPILGAAFLDVLKASISHQATTEVTEAVSISPEIGIFSLVIGFLSAFIIGCVACKWLLNIVKKGKLVWFALYCLATGLLCIVYTLFVNTHAAA